jgi:hypothetical protein
MIDELELAVEADERKGPLNLDGAAGTAVSDKAAPRVASLAKREVR